MGILGAGARFESCLDGSGPNAPAILFMHEFQSRTPTRENEGSEGA